MPPASTPAVTATSLLTAPRVIGWGLVLVLVAGLTVLSPLSPLAARRAEALLLRGRVDEAAALFERIAVYNPDRELALEAWMRAAMVWMVDHPEANRARACLTQVIEAADAPDGMRALAWERLAVLLEGPLHQPDEAAAAWQMAYDTAPDDPRATLRLEEAARALTDAGHPDDAYTVWDKLARRDPSRKAEVKLAQAQILLSKSRLGQAAQHYKAAADADPPSPTTRLAREGQLAVEDRMERLKSTMIEFESRDIPLALKRRIEAAEKKPAAHEIEEAPAPEAPAP